MRARPCDGAHVAAWALATSLVLGCGDSVTLVDGTGGHGAGAGGTASSAAGGLGPCETSLGLRICGGDSGCETLGPGCEKGCFTYDRTGVCFGDAFEEHVEDCHQSPDGSVCLPELLIALPWEVGERMAELGVADDVRHADLGRWNGEPLPEPSSCPTIPGAQLCAPGCAPCPEKHYCRGRAPRHPWGVCVPQHDAGSDLGNNCSICNGGSCLAFEVEPSDEEAAELINDTDICVSTEVCEGVAAHYPGDGLGYTCTPPPG